MQRMCQQLDRGIFSLRRHVLVATNDVCKVDESEGVFSL